jgi:hypothetical protein
MGMMEGTMNMSMIRHHFVMQNGIDPDYVSKVNPLGRSAENLAAGKKLFKKSCAHCHFTVEHDDQHLMITTELEREFKLSKRTIT